MIIEITQEDINTAEKGYTSVRNCVLAKSLNRTFGGEWTIGFTQGLNYQTLQQIFFPKEVIALIDHFLCDLPISPMSFEAEVIKFGDAYTD